MAQSVSSRKHWNVPSAGQALRRIRPSSPRRHRRQNRNRGIMPPADFRGVHRKGWSRLTAASLSAVLAFAVVWVGNLQGGKNSSREQTMKGAEARDGGTVGLGDEVLTAQQAAPHVASAWPTIGLDLPSKPFRGQTRPDANGRCPFEPLVPINGGCWVPVKEDAKNCPPETFKYRDRCYAPFLRLPGPPISSPSDAPDG